ncbi:MAG TPA: hypothetical protein PLY88_07040 [Candidatus Omnitrophota bacterium]|nr:hypothetical protein [Candidatus Omnitrophota bacterium]
MQLATVAKKITALFVVFTFALSPGQYSFAADTVSAPAPAQAPAVDALTHESKTVESFDFRDIEGTATPEGEPSQSPLSAVEKGSSVENIAEDSDEAQEVLDNLGTKPTQKNNLPDESACTNAVPANCTESTAYYADNTYIGKKVTRSTGDNITEVEWHPALTTEAADMVQDPVPAEITISSLDVSAGSNDATININLSGQSSDLTVKIWDANSHMYHSQGMSGYYPQSESTISCVDNCSVNAGWLNSGTSYVIEVTAPNADSSVNLTGTTTANFQTFDYYDTTYYTPAYTDIYVSSVDVSAGPTEATVNVNLSGNYSDLILEVRDAYGNLQTQTMLYCSGYCPTSISGLNPNTYYTVNILAPDASGSVYVSGTTSTSFNTTPDTTYSYNYDMAYIDPAYSYYNNVDVYSINVDSTGTNDANFSFYTSNYADLMLRITDQYGNIQSETSIYCSGYCSTNVSGLNSGENYNAELLLSGSTYSSLSGSTYTSFQTSYDYSYDHYYNYTDISSFNTDNTGTTDATFSFYAYGGYSDIILRIRDASGNVQSETSTYCYGYCVASVSGLNPDSGYTAELAIPDYSSYNSYISGNTSLSFQTSPEPLPEVTGEEQAQVITILKPDTNTHPVIYKTTTIHFECTDSPCGNNATDSYYGSDGTPLGSRNYDNTLSENDGLVSSQWFDETGKEIPPSPRLEPMNLDNSNITLHSGKTMSYDPRSKIAVIQDSTGIAMQHSNVVLFTVEEEYCSAEGECGTIMADMPEELRQANQLDSFTRQQIFEDGSTSIQRVLVYVNQSEVSLPSAVAAYQTAFEDGLTVSITGENGVFFIRVTDSKEWLIPPTSGFQSMSFSVDENGQIISESDIQATYYGKDGSIRVDGNFLMQALNTCPKGELCAQKMIAANDSVYLAQMTSVSVSKVENAAIYFSRGESNYKAYRDESGQIVLERQKAEIVLPPAVASYIQAIRDQLGDDSTRINTSLQTDGTYLVVLDRSFQCPSGMMCTMVAPAPGSFGSMSFSLNADGTRKAGSISADYNGVMVSGKDADLLFAAMNVCPEGQICPMKMIAINNAVGEASVFQQMMSITVKKVENGAVYFSIGEHDYKVYRDEAGKIIVELDLVRLDVSTEENLTIAAVFGQQAAYKKMITPEMTCNAIDAGCSWSTVEYFDVNNNLIGSRTDRDLPSDPTVFNNADGRRIELQTKIILSGITNHVFGEMPAYQLLRKTPNCQGEMCPTVMPIHTYHFFNKNFEVVGSYTEEFGSWVDAKGSLLAQQETLNTAEQKEVLAILGSKDTIGWHGKISPIFKITKDLASGKSETAYFADVEVYRDSTFGPTVQPTIYEQRLLGTKTIVQVDESTTVATWRGAEGNTKQTETTIHYENGHIYSYTQDAFMRLIKQEDKNEDGSRQTWDYSYENDSAREWNKALSYLYDRQGNFVRINQVVRLGDLTVSLYTDEAGSFIENTSIFDQKNNFVSIDFPKENRFVLDGVLYEMSVNQEGVISLQQLIQPFEISLPASTIGGENNLKVRVDAAGNAFATWYGTEYIGKFDPDTKQIVISFPERIKCDNCAITLDETMPLMTTNSDASDIEKSVDTMMTEYWYPYYEGKKTWTLQLSENLNRVLSFERSEEGGYWSYSSTSKAHYNENGMIEFESWSNHAYYGYNSGKTDYTYVEINGKQLVASIISKTNSHGRKIYRPYIEKPYITNHVAEKIETQPAEEFFSISKPAYYESISIPFIIEGESVSKIFNAYDAEGNMVQQVSLYSSTHEGETTYSGSYTNYGAHIIESASAKISAEIFDAINSAGTQDLIDQHANTKTEQHFSGSARKWEGHKFTITHARDENGFTPRFVQMADYQTGYFVQGNPDVLSGESDDIRIKNSQTINGYNIYVGEAHEEIFEMVQPTNANDHFAEPSYPKSVQRYLGYGLVFSKWGEKEDGSYGQTIVLVDYPAVKTVELDGQIFEIELDVEGNISLLSIAEQLEAVKKEALEKAAAEKELNDAAHIAALAKLAQLEARLTAMADSIRNQAETLKASLAALATELESALTTDTLRTSTRLAIEDTLQSMKAYLENSLENDLSVNLSYLSFTMLMDVKVEIAARENYATELEVYKLAVTEAQTLSDMPNFPRLKIEAGPIIVEPGIDPIEKMNAFVETMTQQAEQVKADQMQFGMQLHNTKHSIAQALQVSTQIPPVINQDDMPTMDANLTKAAADVRAALENLRKNLIEQGYMQANEDGSLVNPPQKALEIESQAMASLRNLYEGLMSRSIQITSFRGNVGEKMLVPVSELINILIGEMEALGLGRWSSPEDYLKLKGLTVGDVGEFNPGDGMFAVSIFDNIMYDMAFGPSSRDLRNMVIRFISRPANSEQFVGTTRINPETFRLLILDREAISQQEADEAKEMLHLKDNVVVASKKVVESAFNCVAEPCEATREVVTEYFSDQDHDFEYFGQKVEMFDGDVLVSTKWIDADGNVNPGESKMPYADAIAEHLGVSVSDIIKIESENRPFVTCMGPGCATWSKYLDVTVKINGEEKHFAGYVVGGAWGQEPVMITNLKSPYRSIDTSSGDIRTIFLLETDPLITGQLLEEIGESIGISAGHFQKVESEPMEVCQGENCPAWKLRVRFELKQGENPVRVFTGTITQLSEENRINLHEMKPLPENAVTLAEPEQDLALSALELDEAETGTLYKTTERTAVNCITTPCPSDIITEKFYNQDGKVLGFKVLQDNHLHFYAADENGNMGILKQSLELVQDPTELKFVQEILKFKPQNRTPFEIMWEQMRTSLTPIYVRDNDRNREDDDEDDDIVQSASGVILAF